MRRFLDEKLQVTQVTGNLGNDPDRVGTTDRQRV
jgi:hypothetical protein